MRPLQGLAGLLLLQSVGELLSRSLNLPVPGPVVGMLLLVGLLRWPPTRPALEAGAQRHRRHPG